jgi:predicted transcriptional regulator
MELNSIIDLLDAKIIAGKSGNLNVETGFCSDLMSDVLTLETDKMLLITGTANLQTIRTAEMADIHCILLVRNKKATKEMINLAEESGIVILETSLSSFRCCGILYNAGLNPVY